LQYITSKHTALIIFHSNNLLNLIIWVPQI